MIDVLTYKNRIADIVDELGKITKDTEYEKNYIEFRKKYDDVAKENKVRIVFAGPYSAGKSSIIKGLTERDDIKIGEEPTTDEICYYDYNGLSIVDTPGLYANIPEHEEKARETYEKADVIVFCTTADILLDDETSPDYKLIASREGVADKIILCVNKMDFSGVDFVNQKDEAIDTLQGVIDNLGINNPYEMCFISAKKYLESFGCEQKEKEDKVKTASHFGELVNCLNKFCDERNVLAFKCGTIADTVSKFIREIKTEEDKKCDSAEINKEQSEFEKRRSKLYERVDKMLHKIDELFKKGYDQLSEDLRKEDDEITKKHAKDFENERVEEIRNEIEWFCDEWGEYITDQSDDVRTENVEGIFNGYDKEKKGKKKGGLKLGSKTAESTNKFINGITKNSGKAVAEGAKETKKTGVFSKLVGKLKQVGKKTKTIEKTATKQAGKTTAKQAGKTVGKVSAETVGKILGVAADVGFLAYDIFSDAKAAKNEKQRKAYVNRIKGTYLDRMNVAKTSIRKKVYDLRKQVVDNMQAKLQNRTNIQQQLAPLESELSNILSMAKENGNE